MIVHAAGESGPAAPGTIAILLAAKNEAELRRLASLDPGAQLIVESEGPLKGQALAVGFPPCAEKKKHFGHLPLWRGGLMT